jgi:enoyl-CoA hydratase
MFEAVQADSSAVITEHHGSLAIIHLTRPSERNSLSLSTLKALDQTVSGLLESRDTTALIFTGTDDVFASGANIRELSALTPETARAFAQLGQNLFHKIANARQLTLAAINGYCMGGGLDFALACQLRFASSKAIFAHPGARLGIITGWGGTQRLPRLVSPTRALEMFTTARRLSSSEAYEVGLINRVCDPVLDCAIEFVRQRERGFDTKD